MRISNSRMEDDAWFGTMVHYEGGGEHKVRKELYLQYDLACSLYSFNFKSTSSSLNLLCHQTNGASHGRGKPMKNKKIVDTNY